MGPSLRFVAALTVNPRGDSLKTRGRGPTELERVGEIPEASGFQEDTPSAVCDRGSHGSASKTSSPEPSPQSQPTCRMEPSDVGKALEWNP